MSEKQGTVNIIVMISMAILAMVVVAISLYMIILNDDHSGTIALQGGDCFFLTGEATLNYGEEPFPINGDANRWQCIQADALLVVSGENSVSLRRQDDLNLVLVVLVGFTISMIGGFNAITLVFPPHSYKNA